MYTSFQTLEYDTVFADCPSLDREVMLGKIHCTYVGAYHAISRTLDSISEKLEKAETSGEPGSKPRYLEGSVHFCRIPTWILKG